MLTVTVVAYYLYLSKLKPQVVVFLAWETLKLFSFQSQTFAKISAVKIEMTVGTLQRG